MGGGEFGISNSEVQKCSGKGSIFVGEGGIVYSQII